jgi:hypothetical protein
MDGKSFTTLLYVMVEWIKSEKPNVGCKEVSLQSHILSTGGATLTKKKPLT